MSPPPGKPSTFDLLRWSDTPDEPPVRTPGRVSATNDSKGFASAADESFRETPAAPRSSNRKPAGGPSTFAFSEQISSEEAEALLKRKPLSETKKKEMSGNKLFSDDPNGIPSTPERVGSGKLVQPPSQISFGESGRVSPKRPATPAEIAKQRELGGSQQTVEDVQWRRLNSSAKAKELVGSNIFSKSAPAEDEPQADAPLPPPSSPPATPLLGLGTPGRATTPERKRAMAQKTAELSGHDIFKKDPLKTPLEKHASSAKLKEMSGHDIFADDKPVPRECLGGVRKPPGGESTIALV